MRILLPLVYTIVASAVVFAIFCYFHTQNRLKERIKTFHDFAHSVGLSKYDIDYDNFEWRIKNHRLTECIKDITIDSDFILEDELIFLALLNEINRNDESTKKIMKLISAAEGRILSRDEAMLLREQVSPGSTRGICKEAIEGEDIDYDAPDLDEILFVIEEHLEEIFKRQEEAEIDEAKISIRDESFAEFNDDGSIKLLGHRDIIDYDKHDMDFDGIKEKTLQEFYRLSKLFSLDAYRRIYEEVESALRTMDYDTRRYRHGEFNPPDMIACYTMMDIVEQKIEDGEY